MTELRERVRGQTDNTINADYHERSGLHIFYSDVFKVAGTNRVSFKAQTECRVKIDDIIDAADNTKLWSLLRGLENEAR